MNALWSRVGRVLASIAKVAAKAAVWASQHPDAVQMVGALAVGAGAPPAAVGRVEAGIGIAGAAAGRLGPR